MMREINKTYIITGPPGAGKTTLIQALSQKGFSAIPEVSRDIIIEQQKTGGNAFPWGDVVRYASLVFKETKVRLKENTNSLFVDRSLIDTMAYLEFSKQKIAKELLEFPFHQYYHKTVFFAPSWAAIYEIDPQRPQQFKELVGLQEVLWNTYEKLGFTCVVLPKTDVETRMNFVFHKIDL